MDYKLWTARGFTLIEILISVAVIGILSAATLSAFGSFLKSKTAEGASYEVLSALSKARSMTLASKDSSQYGVRFDAGSVTIFKGASFAPGNPENKVFPLTGAGVTNISLGGGGQSVVFERLSGRSAQSGTVTVSGIGGGGSRVINIYETGLAE